MDMLTVDLTDLTNAGIGSEVALWGNRVSVDTVAKAAATCATTLVAGVKHLLKALAKTSLLRVPSGIFSASSATTWLSMSMPAMAESEHPLGLREGVFAMWCKRGGMRAPWRRSGRASCETPSTRCRRVSRAPPWHTAAVLT